MIYDFKPTTIIIIISLYKIIWINQSLICPLSNTKRDAPLFGSCRGVINHFTSNAHLVPVCKI